MTWKWNENNDPECYNTLKNTDLHEAKRKEK